MRLLVDLEAEVTCTPIKDGEGRTVGFICSRGRSRRKKCGACGTPGSAIYACDWKLHGPRKGETCDMDLCSACATKVGDDKHLCPGHLRMWERHPKHPKNQAPMEGTPRKSTAPVVDLVHTSAAAGSTG